MRIAELAVPTKRQCLDTWRNKSHTLPAFMIERLRQLVLDQTPVVKIADAFTCFNKKRKKESETNRPAGDYTCKCCRKNKKQFRKSELKTMCAIFGHKIAKKLNIPMNISLHPDLTNIACVVYYDIGNLLHKSRKIDMCDDINISVHKEISYKIAIWIYDVLNESNQKYLEDQIKDFEEEAGPVLDFLDDLVDNVLNNCIPECKESIKGEDERVGLEECVPLEESGEHEHTEEDDENVDQSNENVGESDENVDEGDENVDQGYENIDQGDENVDQGVENVDQGIENVDQDVENVDQVDENVEPGDENIDQDEQNVDQGDENIEQGEEKIEQVDENIDQGDENIEQVDENIEQGDKNIEQDDKNINDYEGKSAEKDEDIDRDADTKSNENLNENEGQDLPSSEVAKDTNEPLEDTDLGKNENAQNNEMTKEEKENLESEPKEPDTEISLHSETDIDKKTNEEADIPPITEDDNTETFTDAIDDMNKLPEASPVEDKSQKIQITIEKTPREAKTPEEADVSWKASIEHISFAPPNDDLLSNADESWPEDFHASALKPSQSVSKSITSLGNIQESEERESIIPTDSAPASGQQEVDDKESEEKGKKTKDSTKPRDAAGKETKKQKKDKNPTKPDKTTVGKADKTDNQGTKIEKVIPKIKKDKVKPECKKIETKPTKEGEQKIPKPKKPTSPRKNIEPIPAHKPKIRKGCTKKPKEKKQAGTSQYVTDMEPDLDSVQHSKYIKTYDGRSYKYRVEAKTAPAWVSRNFGVSTCSIGKTKTRGTCHINDVKRWCRDLDQGYENLTLWNKWIQNTGRTVCMLQKEIHNMNKDSACLDCPELYSKKEWMRLKRCIDSDAALWKNLKHNTRGKMKNYRKIYQKRSKGPVILCDCPPSK